MSKCLGDPRDPAYEGPTEVYDCSFCYSKKPNGFCPHKGREVEREEAEECENYEFDCDSYLNDIEDEQADRDFESSLERKK